MESIGNSCIMLLRDLGTVIAGSRWMHSEVYSNLMSLGLCRWYCAQTRGTQRPDVSKYAISASDGFLYICFRSLFG